jgi:hypothetical protein
MEGAAGSLDGQEAALDWPGAGKFVEVQVLLDKNVVLINQINENHTIRTPEALQRNVMLIKELNSNVQRITDLYKQLSSVLTGSEPEGAISAAAKPGARAASTAGH